MAHEDMSDRGTKKSEIKKRKKKKRTSIKNAIAIANLANIVTPVEHAQVAADLGHKISMQKIGPLQLL
jgi:hypothetical protein